MAQYLAACHTGASSTLSTGEGAAVNAAVVLNEPRRLTAPSLPVTLSLPESLQLHIEPLADSRRYDSLRRRLHVH